MIDKLMFVKVFAPLAVLSLLLCGCESKELIPQATASPIQSQESANLKLEQSSKQDRRAAGGALSASAGRSAGGRMPHRTRAASERGSREVQHPASGLKRPEKFSREKPAAATVVDLPGGTVAKAEANSENELKLKDLGLTDVTVLHFEKPMSQVLEHYATQANGKARPQGKKATVVYQVREGTLLVSMGEKGGNTLVTRALINKEAVPERVPGWLRELAGENR